MPITPRCADAAALLAGLPAREAAAALEAHRAECPTCTAALAGLGDDLAEDRALGEMLAARAEMRAAAGRPLQPLRPALRRAPVAAAPVAGGRPSRWGPFPIPSLALAGVAAVLVLLLGGTLFLARLGSNGPDTTPSQVAERAQDTANTVPAGQAASRSAATVAPSARPAAAETSTPASESTPEDTSTPSAESQETPVAATPAPTVPAQATPAPSTPVPPTPPVRQASPPAAATAAPTAAPTEAPQPARASPTEEAATPEPTPAPTDAPAPTSAPTPLAEPSTTPRPTAARTPPPAAASAPEQSAPPAALATAVPSGQAGNSTPERTATATPTAAPIAPPLPAFAPTPSAARTPAGPMPAAASPTQDAAPATAASADSRPTTIVSAPGTVSPGAGVSISVQATPGSTCSIAAGALGEGVESALSTRPADASGRVSWSWTVPDVPPGQYAVTITCNGSTASTPITVRG